MIYSMESEGLQIPSAAAGSLANKRSLLRNDLFCCTLTPYEHKCSTGFGVQQKAMRFASPFCLRKVRDSNPRNPEGFNRFRVCPVRPLRQLSAAKLHNYSELMTIKIIFFAALFYLLFSKKSSNDSQPSYISSQAMSKFPVYQGSAIS